METIFWDDKIKNVPVCKALVENYAKIKQEVVSYLQQPNVLFSYPKYKDHDLYENYWKACPVTDWISEEYLNFNASKAERDFFLFLVNRTKQSCPTFASIIKEQEEEGNIANGFISRLLPGTTIKTHRGWIEGWVRTHLGLVCDPECKITVGEETRTWEEGKLLAFHDWNFHSVKHCGTQERIVISVDIKISYLNQFILSSAN